MSQESFDLQFRSFNKRPGNLPTIISIACQTRSHIRGKTILLLVIGQSIQLHIDSMDLTEILTISSRPLVLIQCLAQTVLMHHRCKIALIPNRKLRDPFLSQRPRRVIPSLLSTQLLSMFRLLILELQYLTQASSLVLPFSIIFLLPLQFRPQYFVNHPSNLVTLSCHILTNKLILSLEPKAAISYLANSFECFHEL